MPDASSTAIYLDAVSVARDGTPVLQQLTGRICYGQITGLAGVSGSGKSTLLHLLANVIQAQKGRITRNAPADSTSTLPHILRLPQHPLKALNPSISIGRQFRCINKPGRQPGQTRAPGWRDCLAQVGLDVTPDLLAAKPQQLSGGECQRVVWAMVRYRKPDIVLLDEPTSALDAEWQHALMQQLADWVSVSSIAAVFVSHSVDLLLQYSDQIWILNHARIADQFAPDAVYDAHRAAISKQIVGTSAGNSGSLSGND